MAFLPAERNVPSFEALLKYTDRHRLRPLKGTLFLFDEGEIADEIKGSFGNVSVAKSAVTVRFLPDANEEGASIQAIDAESFVKDSVFVISRHFFE